MNKSYYRNLFMELKPFIKLSAFCRIVGIDRSALSLFLRDEQHDHCISLQKLGELERAIMDFMSNFA